jgi:MinD-like ATPase involved in chromosome partitioning or flagellar assembly
VTTVEPTVALVFSPEQWVEDLHRYLVHHGGARVRQIVVEPSVALEEEYDALVVSDRWPALTRRFVDEVHDLGRRVLGVFDPEEPAGKDHLLALGVDATLAGDAPMTEFVGVLAELRPLPVRGTNAPSDRDSVDGTELRLTAVDRGRLVVVSGPRGSGITEIAVGLAAALAGRADSVVLVDAHEHAPSIAGRLGLGLEPNLRSAIDAFTYGLGNLDRSIVRVPAPAAFGVVAGFPSPVAAAQVTANEVVEVAHALCDRPAIVVVDADDGSPITRALVAECSDVVGVADASPIGIVRALGWFADVRTIDRATPVHLVVNRAPAARYRRAEIQAEITRTVAPASLSWVPSDRAIAAATWDGRVAGRGPFRAALGEVARAVKPAPSSRLPRRRHRGRR